MASSAGVRNALWTLRSVTWSPNVHLIITSSEGPPAAPPRAARKPRWCWTNPHWTGRTVTRRSAHRRGRKLLRDVSSITERPPCPRRASYRGSIPWHIKNQRLRTPGSTPSPVSMFSLQTITVAGTKYNQKWAELSTLACSVLIGRCWVCGVTDVLYTFCHPRCNQI